MEVKQPAGLVSRQEENNWWMRNKKPRTLVEAPSLNRTYRAIDEVLKRQPLGAVVDDVKQVAVKLYDAIGTNLSLKLKEALLVGDVVTIATCRVNPRDYVSPPEYFLDVQAASFLRKYEDLASLGKNPNDLEELTKREFFRAEQQCKDTNGFITMFAEGKSSPIDRRVSEIIRRAQWIIKQALKDVPSVSKLPLRFGPGTTSACTGDSVTIADKLVAYPELTLDSLPYIAAMKSSRVWCDLIRTAHPTSVYNLRLVTDDYGNEVFLGCDIAPKLVRGNRFTAVPKDATINRGICIEPHTLSALQLAAGALITDALARLGIVKDAQQVVNRRFASFGAQRGFATVDLKAASDTIAYEIVKLLLPWDWFEFLASLRSQETYINGEWIECEKFSSMGNGFTFELETLLFYALSRSVSDVINGENNSPVCTYGDDIIIADNCSELLTKVLDFCGFTVNHSKSFWNGPFRESCGSDFFDGHDVRPFYLKESPTHASDWYRIANGIARSDRRYSDLGFTPLKFGPAWLRCVNNVPKPARLFGPEGYGDDWIITDQEARWKTKVQGGLTFLLGARRNPRYRSLSRYCDETQYTALLYGGVGQRLALRGEPESVTVEWYTIVR